MKEEVREIVKQRKKFEYRLKRKNVEKQDFVRYIRYEMELSQYERD